MEARKRTRRILTAAPRQADAPRRTSSLRGMPGQTTPAHNAAQHTETRMHPLVLVVGVPTPEPGKAAIEARIAGDDVRFEYVPALLTGHDTLRRLRGCDALVRHDDLPVPGWAAGLMTNCRIVVQSAAGVAASDLRSFGERGMAVCTSCAIEASENGPFARARAASPLALLVRRLRAACTVTLFLRDGILRDCVNAEWLHVAGPARIDAGVEGGRHDRADCT